MSNSDNEFPIPKLQQWGTFVRDRQPQFKTHTTVGHAHAAINDKFRWRYHGNVKGHGQAKSDCALYQYDKDTDGWVLQQEWQAGVLVGALPWQVQPPPTEMLLAKERTAAVDRLHSHLSRELLGKGLGPDATNSMKDLIERFVRDAKRITL